MGLHYYCANGWTIVGHSVKRTTRRGLYSFGIVDEGK